MVRLYVDGKKVENYWELVKKMRDTASVSVADSGFTSPPPVARAETPLRSTALRERFYVTGSSKAEVSPQ